MPATTPIRSEWLRCVARVPLPPGNHSRVPAAGEVAAQHLGDVGQPLGPALCQPRLLSDRNGCDALLEFLYRQATIPEYQLRVKWQPNTLVMWDNRSVQHYASHDYYPARRTMARVTVKGDRPVGPTGAYTPDTVPANGTVKPAIAEGTRPGPKRAFDRY